MVVANILEGFPDSDLLHSRLLLVVTHLDRMADLSSSSVSLGDKLPVLMIALPIASLTVSIPRR